MMQGRKNAGSADSGSGVLLAGFYAPNAEVDARLKTLDADFGPFSEIAIHECEGWTAAIASSEGAGRPGCLKIGVFRREAHRFFEDLPAWLFKTNASHIHRLSISQSSGFLSLTCLYSDDPVRA